MWDKIILKKDIGKHVKSCDVKGDPLEMIFNSNIRTTKSEEIAILDDFLL